MKYDKIPVKAGGKAMNTADKEGNRYDMENHITSKGEKERMFLEIKENKSYIFNPMGVSGFHGVFPFTEK